MKPKNILYFIVIIFALFGVLMLFFPDDGLKITDNFTLKFTNWNTFLSKKEEKDISSILENNIANEDTVEFVQTNFDTAYVDNVPIVYQPISISVDSTLQQIEFPEGKDTILNSVFQSFVETQATGRKIHVLHYGDSQIEVDRMTSYFRMKLQATFGGMGCGFHPGLQTYNFTNPMVVNYSENWRRYNVFPKKDTLVTHKRYGIYTNFSMFKAVNDTTKTEQTAWIEFTPSQGAYSSAKNFNQLKLFYGYNKSEVNVEVYSNGALIFQDNLPAREGLQIKTWDFAEYPANVKLVFKGTSSPEIYGYSFEGNSGICVDNLPVRGSGGTFFGSMDLSLTGQMYNYMNVKLIILQFGGNSIHGDSAAIKGYVNGFGKQIRYLQNIAPNARIIVIGPADMSEKDGDNYITIPRLPYLVNLIRNEAFKNNCAFWDMYSAMGGFNSMPSWVFHEPSLAEKDFIHFTPNGANIVAQIFYKALVVEYNKFVEKKSL
jgi:hypothetical protein